MTAQPKWELVANLGDVNPLDYGGYFVYRDATGVYTEEAEWLEEPCEGDERYTVYRFALDRCTFVNGILSDNQFHPDHPAWFADDIDAVASCCGMDPAELVRMFCSADPIARAEAYRAVGSYYGMHEFDHYPLRLTPAEAEQRYSHPAEDAEPEGPRMPSGYCFEFTGEGDPFYGPSDPWDIVVYAPSGDEQPIGCRFIDGSKCVVFLCPGGKYRAVMENSCL